MLLRSYLLASIDSVSFSTVWIRVGGVFITSSISTLPNRFCDAVDCARHPALRHPATIRRRGATRNLAVAVNARATVSTVHHDVVEHVATVERETHADEWVIKEAARATVARIMAAVPSPRVKEKWVRHQVAKNRLEKSEGVSETGMMRPLKVKWIIREWHILLPGGMMRAAVMARSL